MLDDIIQAMPKGQRARLNKGGFMESNRHKGKGGYFEAILDDPKELLDSNSYLRRILYCVTDSPKTSSEITNDFNEKYKDSIKEPTTQGSVSNYLSRLEVYGLVHKVSIERRYVRIEGLDNNDGKALYRRASERQKYWLQFVETKSKEP
jgi:hypothetical protein